MLRDYQKRKLYGFESKVLWPMDSEEIGQQEAQDWVNFIWSNEGRNHPPVVIVNRKLKVHAGNANRQRIHIQEKTRRFVMIHELTHSMQFKLDDDGEQYLPVSPHGGEFVFLYFTLLEKYMNIPMPMLMYKGKESGLKMKVI